ncbi:uracil-DNA glycosylase family protein [Anaerobacillus sp. 1_MG-2023]|uniref:uracil-DNA glycosylase family protein n=1 Tax=Bacillales TaxID=1385 RepID=UPI0026E47A57|nr:uracil-DNA glycosylase family protein [Anaerobacillus sp. 1_MG-2023]MDO6655754.1 hypothetical protein [Anaerobacillus sp. 1_MG-2023]
MDTVEKFEKQYVALAKQYEVSEVMTPKSKLIFILESPHVSEVENGVPVAGPSGATMSKKLFGPEYSHPLGLLLKKHQEESMERPSLDVVGLLNVCNIPMQSKPYAESDRNANSELLEHLSKIRTSNQKTPYKDNELLAVQQLILEKFRNRLKAISNRELTIIPCGRFAQKFFQLANVSSEKWTVIMDVPHPSYNSWSRERYQDAISNVLNEFNRHKI